MGKCSQAMKFSGMVLNRTFVKVGLPIILLNKYTKREDTH